MKKISIIIPVYNRKADLARCLGSIQSARPESYEVVAVDDASTDGSWEWLQQADYPNLTVLRNEANRGVNYTRNRGIERATGEYVLFLDSDDKLLPGGLDVVLENLAAHPEVRHFLFFEANVKPTDAIAQAPTTDYSMWLTQQIYGDFTHALRREILLEYPFFEQFRAYEELNWLRIYRATSPQKVIPEMVAWRDVQRTDNLTKSLRLKSTEAIAGKFNYLKLYFELYGADLYALAPAQYRAKFHHALLLGVAAHLKPAVRALIDASPLPLKGLYKSVVGLTPSSALQKLITLK